MTNTPFNYALGLMICAGLSATAAQASGTSDKAPHRDAHVHGHSKLMMASDKNIVTVKLEIPGMDIFGFEYEAKTAKDKKIVADAVELFKNPYNVVSFPEAAGCVVDKVSTDIKQDDHDHHGEEHGHDDHHGKKDKKKKKDDHGHHDDEHGHDDHHGKKDKKKKKDDHDHDDHHGKKDKKKKDGHGDKEHGHDDHHEGEQHNELKAKYVFKCKNVKAVDSVTINLFSRFSGMKKVSGRAAMASGQYSAKLTPSNKVFKLK